MFLSLAAIIVAEAAKNNSFILNVFETKKDYCFKNIKDETILSL